MGTLTLSGAILSFPQTIPRIALVLSSAEWGGAEHQALVFARELMATKTASPIVCAMGDGDAVANRCADFGVPFHRLSRVESRYPWLEYVRMLRCACQIRRLSPDVVLPFADPANRMVAIFRRWIGAQRTLWNQRDAGLHRGHPWLERRALDVSHFVANGPDGIAHLHRLGVPLERIGLVPNGLEVASPQPERGAWRRRAGIPDGTWIVAMVGNLHAGKGYREALQVWKAFRDHTRDSNVAPALLVIAGRDDGERAQLELQAATLGISEQVVFLGAISNVRELLASSDAFLMTSSSEGCSNAVMEAMAAALPIVGWNLPAMRWLLGSRSQAYLAPRGDISGLRDKLCTILYDRAAGQRSGAEVAQRIALFSCSRMATAYGRALGIQIRSHRAMTSREVSVAVLIPSKNRHAALAQTLMSVIPAARVAQAEIMICDQSAQAFPACDGIRVLHRPDITGLPAARNVLMAATQADVVCFLDDDVTMGSDFVRQLQQVAASEPDCDGWGPVVEVRSARLRLAHRLVQMGCFHDERRLLARRCDQVTSALFGCAFAVRREVAIATGFDSRRAGYALGEDFDFFRRFPGRSRFVKSLKLIHRGESSNRAEPDERGIAKGRFLTWLARRHGQGNPATLVHLALALIAAASGRGAESASWRGVIRGALKP